MGQCAKVYFQSNGDNKWEEKSTAGKRSCQEGSVNNTMKNKQKYTLTHERNCPWPGVHFRVRKDETIEY